MVRASQARAGMQFKWFLVVASLLGRTDKNREESLISRQTKGMLCGAFGIPKEYETSETAHNVGCDITQW
jgi:hypothetical protein